MCKSQCSSLRLQFIHAYAVKAVENVNFQLKKFDIFLIFAQNSGCGYTLGLPQLVGSNEYSQSMFQSKNMKNNVYPCKPQFYYIKVGCKGV